MTQIQPPPAQRANPRLLHQFLGIGQIVTAAALIIARQSGAMGESVETNAPTAYVMTGASVIAMMVALAIFKPKVPERRPGQSVTQYWSDPAVTASVVRVWILLEGAAIVAAVGYFLTGAPLLLAPLVIAIAVFWFTGPNAFARE